jgi:hypothetical protein
MYYLLSSNYVTGNYTKGRQFIDHVGQKTAKLTLTYDPTPQWEKARYQLDRRLGEPEG